MRRIFCLFITTMSLLTFLHYPIAKANNQHNYFAFTFTSKNTNGSNILDPFMLDYIDITTRGIIVVADAAKSHLLKMPAGQRCINIHLVSNNITKDAEATVFWHKGAEYVKDIISSFFQRLKEIDAPLDYVIDDMEHSPSNWNLNTDEKINQVVNHPLYESEIKPLLAEREFPFGTDEQGDLYYVRNWSKHPSGYLIWNRVLRNYVNALYDQSIFEPIKKFYPAIKLANYDCTDTDGITTLMSDPHGHKIYKGGAVNKVGTHSSPVCYGALGQILNSGRAPDGYPYSQFKETAFNSLLLEIIKCQDAVLCTPDGKIMPWIGLKTWTNYSACRNFMRTDYYPEFIFQLALLCPDPFLLFDVGGDDVTVDINTLSKYFDHLDEVTQNQIGVPLVKKPAPWSSRYMLNGMDLADKSIWRITPDLYTKGVTIENFLVSEQPLVFQIGNQIVTFPEGSSIYAPSEKLSEYGYWVTAPKGTIPKETIDVTLTDPGEPIFTEDYVPTGYMYESESTKIASDKSTAEQTDTPSHSSIAPNEIPMTSPDVLGHWAEKELNALINAGILNGTDKGIEPDKTLTKAEFIAMLIRSMGIKPNAYEGGLSDVSAEQWFADSMQTAMDYKWLSPENGNANPLQPLSRQDMALILAKGLGVAKKPSGNLFVDHSEIREDAQEAVYGLLGISIINGYPDGSFSPNEILTRAQAAVILYKSML